MAKLWAVVKREYLERVRTRWFLVATVLGPVFFAVVMFLPAYMSSRTAVSDDIRRIHVIDATGTDVGRLIASELGGGIAGDTVTTRVVEVAPSALAGAEATAVRAIVAGDIKGYLVVDPGTLAGRPARYVGVNATSLTDMGELESRVRAEVLGQRLRAAGVSASDADVLKDLPFELATRRLSPSGAEGAGRVSVLFAITLAVLLYFSIFLYGQAVLRGVLEEKQTRVAEIVVSSVSPSKLLGGKVIGVGAVGLTQMLLWGVAAWLLLQVRGPLLDRLGIPSLPLQIPHVTVPLAAALVLFFVLGYTFYAALFAAVGAMVSSEQDAQQAQLPAAMLLMLSVIFMQPVLQAPDGALAVQLSWLPFSAPIIMPLRMSTVSVPVWQIVASLGGLLLACIVAVFLAARIYRTGLLMYGKRPTLRELGRWILVR